MLWACGTESVCFLVALWHRWRLQRKPLILRLHPHGALLPPAETAAGRSCITRGKQTCTYISEIPSGPGSLQLCNVLLLVLQIFDGDSAPQRMVDGWNAYFFNDLDEMVSVLSELIILSVWFMLDLMSVCLCSDDVTQSFIRTRRRWESFGSACCVSTRKSLILKSTSSPSASTSASQPSKNSGRPNASQSKVWTSVWAFCKK